MNWKINGDPITDINNLLQSLNKNSDDNDAITLTPNDRLLQFIYNNKQITIAKKYIQLHKNNIRDDWFLQCNGCSNDQNYLEIYAKLKGGVFGECRDNAEYSDNGETLKEATEFEVEIKSNDSLSGFPILFEWTDL